MVDAAGIIGSGSPGDYGLSPVEHAEQLKTSAPKLAALLTRSAPWSWRGSMRRLILKRLLRSERSSDG